MMRQLEIGPGPTRLPGEWITVDCVPRAGVVDHVCVWGESPLPFPDGSFDLVYAAHVLEHVPWPLTLTALRDVQRVLIPGGTLELHVPDFDVLARAVRYECCFDEHAEDGVNRGLHWMHWAAERLFHRGGAEQWHRACFNESHLRWCLAQAGFRHVEPLATERGVSHGVINLGLRATKPGSAELASAWSPRDGEAAPAAKQHYTRAARAQWLRSHDWVQRGGEGAADETDHGRLSPCHSRREFAPERGLFFCAHPQVHAEDHVVDAQVCATCDKARRPPPEEFRPFRSELGATRLGPCWHFGSEIGLRGCETCPGRVNLKVYACDHPNHDATTLRECARCADFEQQLRPKSVRHWAVGVTTAPRAEPTLSRCLRSLEAAGWSDVRVFAEPGCDTDDCGDRTRWTRRDERLGAWSNWLLGLVELCQREPRADAYLLVQDDVLFCRNLRPFLEQTLWPQTRVGVVSLYNPSSELAEPRGFHALAAQDGLPGALALIFPNYAARLLLGDQYVLAHRRRGETKGTRLIDVVVGQWAARSGLPAVGHFPSLAQHIGGRTTLWGAAEDSFERRAASFLGEEFDAVSLWAEGMAHYTA